MKSFDKLFCNFIYNTIVRWWNEKFLPETSLEEFNNRRNRSEYEAKYSISATKTSLSCKINITAISFLKKYNLDYMILKFI